MVVMLVVVIVVCVVVLVRLMMCVLLLLSYCSIGVLIRKVSGLIVYSSCGSVMFRKVCIRLGLKCVLVYWVSLV